MKPALFACVGAITVLLCASGIASAQVPKEKPSLWIVDDINTGFAEAKKSGKPLMIVFR